jgi:hypothetical protein
MSVRRVIDNPRVASGSTGPDPFGLAVGVGCRRESRPPKGVALARNAVAAAHAAHAGRGGDDPAAAPDGVRRRGGPASSTPRSASPGSAAASAAGGGQVSGVVDGQDAVDRLLAFVDRRRVVVRTADEATASGRSRPRPGPGRDRPRPCRDGGRPRTPARLRGDGRGSHGVCGGCRRDPMPPDSLRRMDLRREHGVHGVVWVSPRTYECASRAAHGDGEKSSRPHAPLPVALTRCCRTARATWGRANPPPSTPRRPPGHRVRAARRDRVTLQVRSP